MPKNMPATYAVGWQTGWFLPVSVLVSTAVLLFRNNMMNTVIDKFGKKVMAYPVDKDHFEIEVRVAVSPQFYGWVFGLKNYVTIVSPPDVVKGMKKHLEAVLKRYEKTDS